MTKYHNKKTEYGGDLYDSRKEANFAMELDLRVKAKDIASWERQVSIPLIAYDVKICTYRIDFIVTHNNKKLEYVEIKGHWTPLARFKTKLFLAQYKNVKYTII